MLKKMKSIEGSKSLLRFVRKTSLFLLLLSPIVGCSDDDDPEVSSVTILALDPPSPASLSYGQRVTITYNYEVIEPSGVRIFVMPYSNGTPSPKYSYTSSPLFTGTGSRDVTITITSGDSEVVVDQLRIVIADHTATTVITEYFEPVEYTYGP
jgi:hypothetical protein